MTRNHYSMLYITGQYPHSLPQLTIHFTTEEKEHEDNTIKHRYWMCLYEKKYPRNSSIRCGIVDDSEGWRQSTSYSNSVLKTQKGERAGVSRVRLSPNSAEHTIYKVQVNLDENDEDWWIEDDEPKTIKLVVC